MENTWITAIGIIFLFAMTTLGASVVFLFKKEISPKWNSVFLGFASGIMIAASIWSLLLPAIEGAKEDYGQFRWIPAAVGFLIGGAFLVLLDRFTARLRGNAEAGETGASIRKKSMKLFLAVTVHNIPEGLSVGFAFGVAAATGEVCAYAAATALAIGIGIQNIPEGAAVSLPMRAAVGSRSKAFLFGLGSGAVEPFAALFGYFLAAFVGVLQPWLLSFAAGAMIFVVAEDLLPDAKLESHPRIGAWGAMIGFTAMMILDVALG